MNKHFFQKVCACFLSVTMLAGSFQYASAEEINQNAANNNISTYSQDPVVSDTVSNPSEEPTVLYELKNEREENVKHFLMSDHTVQALVYSEPVHYMENGEWKDIDNTLSLESAQNSGDFTGYTNKHGDFSVKIAENSSENNLVRIDKDNHRLVFKLIDNKCMTPIAAQNAITKAKDIISKKDFPELSAFISNKEVQLNTESNFVEYKGVTDNNDTDLEYQITGSGLKENIIVNAKQDSYDYSFHLDAENLKLELQNNEINAYDTKTNQLIYNIPAPFMYDSNGQVSTDVSYSLIKDNSGYRLTISADKDWINSSNITFPVTIDPVITTEKTQAAISSTFISSKMASTNFFSGYSMLMTGVESSSYYNCRTLVKLSKTVIIMR